MCLAHAMDHPIGYKIKIDSKLSQVKLLKRRDDLWSVGGRNYIVKLRRRPHAKSEKLYINNSNKLFPMFNIEKCIRKEIEIGKTKSKHEFTMFTNIYRKMVCMLLVAE